MNLPERVMLIASVIVVECSGEKMYKVLRLLRYFPEKKNPWVLMKECPRDSLLDN